ncbi:DNA topoisomerase IV subunit A [Enterococcus sp. 4G2_DIV0659]|uniref:DNA topoisomerase IV subunit A n=1 Tax=Candidatus Enterococcus mansonii TaxID=1834181 RepID=A0ABU8IA19_9ENTE
MKKQYGNDRLTQIENEIQEIKIDTQVLVAQEDVVVTVTHEGYIKRSSLRSYSASKPEEIGMKEGDFLLYTGEVNTLDHILLITNKANVIYRPIHELPDLRWKEIGEHISQTILNLSIDESIIAVYTYKELSPTKTFVFMTKEGMIKQSKMTDFEPWRTYKSRPTNCMKLKSDTDEIVNVYLTNEQKLVDVFLVSHRGFGLRYPLDEVPVVGAKAAGVKAMNLKDEDYVVNGLLVYQEGDTPVVVLTQRGSIKRMLAQELTQLGRAKRGLMVLRELKKNPHRVIFMSESSSLELLVTTQSGHQYTIDSKKYPINDRTSNGSFMLDEKEDGEILEVHEMHTAVLEEKSETDSI